MSIRIGVIGVLYGAKVHIPAYQSEGLDVVAVCARREERSKAAAMQFGIPYAFTDYREMLRMDGLDAVAVVSSPVLHHPMAMAALEAGKHVICEKPFTTTLAEARELWRKAEEAGLTAMIAHEFRFSSGRACVAELVRDGFIGPLHMCSVSLVSGSRVGRGVRPFSEDDDAEAGGGLLWSQGSHYIDCLRHWFGDIKSVRGNVFTHLGQRTDRETGSPRQATSDDAFQATLEFVSGGWASLTFSYVSAFGPGGHIEVYGQDGTLVTPQEPNTPNPPAHGTVLGARVGAAKLEPLPVPQRLQPFEDNRDMRLMPMRLLAREFLRGIREGVSPPPNFEDAFRLQQVLHAVRQSSATGQTVELALRPVQ